MVHSSRVTHFDYFRSRHVLKLSIRAREDFQRPSLPTSQAWAGERLHVPRAPACKSDTRNAESWWQSDTCSGSYDSDEDVMLMLDEAVAQMKTKSDVERRMGRHNQLLSGTCRRTQLFLATDAVSTKLYGQRGQITCKHLPHL